MLNTKSLTSNSLLALKMPSTKIKTILLATGFAALAGCAAKDKSVYPQAEHIPPAGNTQTESSEPVLEEVVVTGTKSRSQRNRKSRSQKRDRQTTEQAYREPQIDSRQLNESSLPILRKNSAQQIFKDYGVSPTISTSNEQFSTFAMDVDTVSYQLAKDSLKSYRLPNKSSIRVEEFVNNFSYNYASTDDVLSVGAEIVPSPYRPGFHLLHLGVKAKHVADQQRLPANIVLVADVSGSMRGDHKMGLQKKALTTLVSQLNSRDTVAIVSYSDNAKIVLKPTKVRNKSNIYQAIQKIKIGGGTNAEQGLQQGYALAGEMAYPGHVNRVVLTSDGLANIGNVDPQKILGQIEHYRKRNIFLTTVGVGKSMYNDYLLEQLANKGNGNYLYLGDQSDIERTFVDGLTTQLQTVAKDAKIQVNFNPEAVSLFRQIGYENRGLETKDFLDASKDGGEVGANQQVTALYEIKLHDSNNTSDIAKVALSYKKPQGSQVFTVDKSIPWSVVRSNSEAASSDTLISMAAAAFAEKLRQSYWSRTYDYRQIQSELTSLPRQVKNSEQVRELRDLVNQAANLDTRNDPYSDRLPLSQINYDRVPLLR